MSMSPEVPALELDTEKRQTLIERSINVFSRPSNAWSGLRSQVQWWFPLLVTVIFQTAGTGLLYHRALYPMMMSQMEESVASGRMPAEQFTRMEQFFSSPAGMAVSLGQQAVVLPIIVLLMAAVVWFGTGFVLGTRMRYRYALEVVSWAGLVRIPELLVFFALSWVKESFQGVHLGLGALIPEPESPNKLTTALVAGLDALGPFAAWFLFVAVLGATALSGAKRNAVGWVLVSLYLGLTVLFTALGAFFGPGA